MGLRWLLRRLGICAAYYNYLKNRKADYRQNKAKILTVIAQIYHERKGIPGYRLMTILLKKQRRQHQRNHLPQVHERRPKTVFRYPKA